MAAPNNISINPKVKQNFIDSVKEYEGYEPKPYKDSQGVLTIGHGINLEDTFNKEYIKKHTPYKVNDVIRGKVKFTEKDSEKYINHKLNNVYREVKKYHPDIDKYPTEVQQIILDMDYNMGPTRFSKFKNFNSAVQKGNYSKAAEELKNSNYFKQTGRRAAAHYSTLAGLTPPVVQPVPEEMGFFDKLKTSFQIMPTSFMTPLIPMMTTPGFADGGEIPSWSPGMTGPPPMPMGFSPEQRERFGLFTEQGNTPYNLQYNAGRYSGVPAGMSMHYGDETGVPDSPCGPGFAIDYDANGFEVCVPIGLKTSGVTPAAVVTSTGSSYGNIGPRTIEEARMRHLRNMAARGPQKRLETFSEEYTMAPVSGTLKTQYTEPFKRESKLGKEPEAKRKLRKGSSFHRGTGFSKFFRGLGTAIRECLPGEDCPKMERGGWVYPANTAYPEYGMGGRLTKKGKKIIKYGPRTYSYSDPAGVTTGSTTQRSIGNTPGGGYMSFGQGGWTGYPDHTMYSSAMSQFDKVRDYTKYAEGGPVWEIIDDRPMAGDGIRVPVNPETNMPVVNLPEVTVSGYNAADDFARRYREGKIATGSTEPMIGFDDPIMGAMLPTKLLGTIGMGYAANSAYKGDYGTAATQAALSAIPFIGQASKLNPTSKVTPIVEAAKKPIIQKSQFFNPIAIADQVVPMLPNPIRIPLMGAGVEGMGPWTGSPLNFVPGYGKTLAGKGNAFRKFGNTMEHVAETKTLSPKGGSAFRIGKDQIVSEGNWAALHAPDEHYPGVFAAKVDFNTPNTRLSYINPSNRNGILLTDINKKTLPDIPIEDPGLSFHRRLPFSNRYVPINKEKILNDQFQLATQGGHLQSLAEKYGMGLAYATGLGAMGWKEAPELYKKYTSDPIVNWYKEKVHNQILDQLKPSKKSKGGSVSWQIID